MGILRFETFDTVQVAKQGPLASYSNTLESLCRRQRKFSLETFGPEQRVAGVLAHIRKELKEVEDSPGDAFEWADVILLAIDGAMRSGIGPEEIAQVIFDKLKINQSRDWPDWRDFADDQPIEHKKD